MKKLLSAIAFTLIMFGCATLGKPVELIAQYFKTYATKTHYVTEQVYPKQDVFWVLEEKRNGDSVEVAVVWIDEVNSAIGVAFDDITVPEPYDYCGIMYFASNEHMNAMLNEFDTSKIVNGQNVPCGYFLQILGEEVERDPVLRNDVVLN